MQKSEKWINIFYGWSLTHASAPPLTYLHMALTDRVRKINEIIFHKEFDRLFSFYVTPQCKRIYV